MGNESINAAILAHRGWVSRFKTGFEGVNTEFFDLKGTFDHRACSLGLWLSDPQALTLLGSEAHARVLALHLKFHQICGSLGTLLNQRDIAQSPAGQLAELDSISREIVQILLRARQGALAPPTGIEPISSA